MGLFSRKDKVVDWTERYKKPQAKDAQKESSSESSQDGFSFLGSLASGAGSAKESEDYIDLAGSSEERRKKLAKRLLDMTNKIEEISNQIYHIQQRIELLEKRAGINRLE